MKTEYYILEPQNFKLDGGAMFGIIPKPLWNKVHSSDEQNRIDLALRLVLLKKGKRIILIDTGIGDYHDKKFIERFAITQKESPLSPLELALAQINLVPADITDLVLSHLHFDHAGGLGKIEEGKMVPIFKSAIVHLHKDHYEYSLQPTERDSGSFQTQYFKPMIEWYNDHHQLHLLEGMEGDILPELHFKCSMGHTPYLLHAYDKKFIYMADLIPTSNHVSIPWVMGYDISPGISTSDKKNFLKFIDDNNLFMIFEHDPLYYGSTVKKNAKGEYTCDHLKAVDVKGATSLF